MKRNTIFCLLLACLTAATMSGCKNIQRKNAEKQIIELTKQMTLPIKLNDATKLTECYYSDKTLTYRNETSADTLAAINVDSLRKTTLNNLKTNSRKLISSVVKADAKIRYIYVNNTDSIMFTFDPDELKK